MASTPGHSSKKTGSSEWPDPPDIPICSTEDEAASLYSDSDDLIPDIDQIIGREGGTYVIRKGRKQRQRLELDSMSSLNSRLSNEANISNVPSPVFPASMNIPNSRHSIDLGSSSINHSSSAHLVNSKAPVHSASHHTSLNSARYSFCSFFLFSGIIFFGSLFDR